MENIEGIFENYRTEFDEINNKRNRIDIARKDVTIFSKRLIFFLHRDMPNQNKFKEAQKKLEQIHQKIQIIADEISTDEECFWRYSFTISWGIEEYIEAVLFYYYLKDNKLKIKIRKKFKNNLIFPKDYLGGLADLTGELMRYSTDAVAHGDTQTPIKVLEAIQQIYSLFISLPRSAKVDMNKLSVMETSMKKIENICFKIQLAQEEFPKVILDETLPQIIPQKAKILTKKRKNNYDPQFKQSKEQKEQKESKEN
ncbi:translin-associated protein x [Anaeramoeba ignava]|uniref:Translin-associated protein x n=1 Tax=Anaeramoeba ignava TaxID=1746090 RepID=A0A9Q0R9U4_ANAIG|nr:translin-associated protein x [Anaeramoeba ignava]